MRRLLSSQGGSATVWSVLAVVVIGALAGSVVVLAGGYASVQRARAAADMSALAGASTGPTGSCAAARRVSTANRAVLVSCRCARDECSVTTAVALTGFLSRLPPVRAQARAGRR